VKYLEEKLERIKVELLPDYMGTETKVIEILESGIKSLKEENNRMRRRIKDYREGELGTPVPDNEPVFCSLNGSTVESYKKGFKTVLKSIGLTVDDEGNPFTLYSLRHTYATMRITALFHSIQYGDIG
jgi:integrase